MITRRTAFALFAVVLTAFSGNAFAAERVAFDRDAFEAGLKSGKPILVDITASWCSTCQRQKAIVTELMQKPEFAGFTIFEVDYDTEKDIMRAFGAQQRSTLIVFKGGVEVGRIVGDTSWTSIDALLAKAV